MKSRTPESVTDFENKAILRELERRMREESFETFKPIDPPSPQKDFLLCNEVRQLAVGGNRSSKTYSAIIKAISLASGVPALPGMELPPTPTYGRVCGSGMEEQVEKVLVEYFRKLVPRRYLLGGEWNYSQRTHMLRFENGSWIEFMSFDQDPEKGAGRSLDWAILDDVGCSKRFMEQTRMRLLDRNGILIRTLCPEEGAQTWEADWWVKAGNREHGYARFKFYTKDNTYLSKKGLQQIIEDIGDDEVQRRIRLEGEFLEIGGLIYTQLQRSTHIRTDDEVGMDDTWVRFVAIDPAPSKEHAVLWGAVGPGNRIHFYRELAQWGQIPDLCEAIRRLSGLEYLQHYFIDGHWDWNNRTAKGTDSESLNLEREFIVNGIPVLKAPLDIKRWQGINQVQYRLKQIRPIYVHGEIVRLPDITFSPEVTRTWEEMTGYAQIPPKKDDPERYQPRIRKVDDDFPDCVRIAITSNPMYMAPYTISEANMPRTGITVEDLEYRP